jgi:hypothetical protein
MIQIPDCCECQDLHKFQTAHRMDRAKRKLNETALTFYFQAILRIPFFKPLLSWNGSFEQFSEPDFNSQHDNIIVLDSRKDEFRVLSHQRVLCRRSRDEAFLHHWNENWSMESHVVDRVKSSADIIQRLIRIFTALLYLLINLWILWNSIGGESQNKLFDQFNETFSPISDPIRLKNWIDTFVFSFKPMRSWE